MLCLAHLFKIQDQDLTSIARLGSGSACRSLYGGFVQWKKGNSEEGDDSIAVQVAPSLHWPEIRILILVVSDNKKTTSSSFGMKQSVQTSELLKYRVQHCVPKRIIDMIHAIKKKDFQTFGKITMQDSNQFHAICLDTFPPCLYMNDTSHMIAQFVHKYNHRKGEIKLAYTFDAGPNACLYLLEENVSEVMAHLHHILPNNNANMQEYIRGLPLTQDYEISEDDKQYYTPIGEGLLKYIIYTKVGEGARVEV